MTLGCSCPASLRTQASILRLAKAVAGSCIKPVECFIIVSCIALPDETILAIRICLRDNVSEFAEFVFAASGKYLGWHLGVVSVSLSYKDPFEKFATN